MKNVLYKSWDSGEVNIYVLYVGGGPKILRIVKKKIYLKYLY